MRRDYELLNFCGLSITSPLPDTGCNPWGRVNTGVKPVLPLQPRVPSVRRRFNITHQHDMSLAPACHLQIDFEHMVQCRHATYIHTALDIEPDVRSCVKDGGSYSLVEWNPRRGLEDARTFISGQHKFTRSYERRPHSLSTSAFLFGINLG